MSTDSTSAGKPVSFAGSTSKPTSTRTTDKDKGKGKELGEEVDEDGDEDEDEEDDDDDMGDEDEDEDEEPYDEIDPAHIVGKRTRGVKVDYTSAEALAKAGLTREEEDEEEENSFATDR